MLVFSLDYARVTRQPCKSSSRSQPIATARSSSLSRKEVRTIPLSAVLNSIPP